MLPLVQDASIRLQHRCLALPVLLNLRD